ncbi:MAG: hypothetical protein IJX16_00465 [Clostridia bacterium]|nr:hypothetical protein [Clostridia bacterium]
MIVWLYIAIILLMKVVQHTFTKANSKNIPSNSVGYLKYTVFYQSIAGLFALILFIFELIKGASNLYFEETLLYASISGIAIAMSCCCSLYVLTTGTMSLSDMFATAGLLVPTIASMFLYQEYLNVWQWLAMVIFMVAAWFLIGASKEKYGKFTLKTFFVLIGTLLLNGLTMLMQTMFGRNVVGGNISLFSTLSFFSGALVILILYMVCILCSKKSFRQNGEKKMESNEFTLLPANKEQTKLPKKVYLFAIFLSFAIFLINQLATLSTPLIAPVILFAFIFGGSTIISAVVGAVIYKEKITLKMVFGLLLGIGSLIMIQVCA